MAGGGSPWFLYHNTRGAHFDNYPSERWLGASAAKHPYRDTIIELDDVVGRLVAALEDSGQLEHTLVVLSSDNGPHMENWPDAGYTPFRSAKGSTWEGGVRVPGIVSWPGMIEPGQVSDGLFAFTDLLPTALRLAGVPDAVPADRFIDGVDQTTFLLAAGGASNRKFHYYWLLSNLAAVRAGEYKFTMRSTSDGATRRRRPRWVHGRRPALHVPAAAQPLPRPQGGAQLPDAQAGVRRRVRHRGAQPRRAPTAPSRPTEWGGPEPGAAARGRLRLLRDRRRRRRRPRSSTATTSPWPSSTARRCSPGTCWSCRPSTS